MKAKRGIGFGVMGILVAALLAGCGGKRDTITVAGSTAFQPFAEQLAERYMGAHPDVNVIVQGGGSALGIQSALSGAAQVGMADLVDLPPEARSLSHCIAARDGISMVVNPANPVDGFTLEQIRGIFNGTIRDWSELGGEGSITVVSREAGSGTRSSFETVVGGMRLTSDAIIQDSNGTIRETVANDPRAVGYLSHGLVNDKVKQVAVDGYPCTTEDVLAGNYKLVRPVFLLTKGAPQGRVKEFIDFVLSAEGQDLIVEDGLLPAR